MNLFSKGLRKVKKKLGKLNRVVIYLTLSDVSTWGAFTLLSVLSGLYLSHKLGSNTVQFVGIGTAIYYITRAIFQIPLGIITDRYKKDKDEILILFVGTLLIGTPFIFFPYINSPYYYYVIQFVFGLGVSLNVITWRKLFALNIDGGKEGIQYATYETILSGSIAILSIIAGIIANKGVTYFESVISFSGIFLMLGSIWAILIYRFEDRKSR